MIFIDLIIDFFLNFLKLIYFYKKNIITVYTVFIRFKTLDSITFFMENYIDQTIYLKIYLRYNLIRM